MLGAAVGGEAGGLRVRDRRGVRPLNWAQKPEAAEARTDKLRLVVQATVEWSSNFSFDQYLQHLTPSIAFSARPTEGNRFIASLDRAGSISGRMIFRAKPAYQQANVDIELNLNPTATRSLVIQSNRAPDLADLPPRSFFRAVPTWERLARDDPPFDREQEKVLAGRDNVLLSLPELGGQWLADRIRSNRDFLIIYERQLRRYLIEILCPARLERSTTTDDLRGEADDGTFRVGLEWNRVQLRYGEIYWEREASDPVGVIERLSSRSQELARAVKVGRYEGQAGYFELERDGGLPTAIIPLTGTRNIDLAFYAKTSRRVRFEIRFKRDFGHLLKNVGTDPRCRLVDLLTRLASHAEKRLPWTELARKAAEPPFVAVTEIGELINKIREATRGSDKLFGPVLDDLIVTGGIFCDEERLPGVTGVIRKLQRTLVVERVELQLKEKRLRRRWGLTSKYSMVRQRMLIGFAQTPAERDPWL